MVSYDRIISADFRFGDDESLFGGTALDAQGASSGKRKAAYAAKRIFDVVVSLSAIVVLLPILILVALAIRLESPGPALFKQVRWGKDCRKILVYKFRSMRSDACDHSGVTQTVVGDARVTKIGAVIRKTNIDELPQLFNVLRGDMSLVGPRCHPVGMQAAGVAYEDLVPEYHLRHKMRPGLTGLAQMRGLRGPTVKASKARARIASDIYYVENFSLMLDMKILAGTVKSEIFRSSGF
jgi:polysaccharide biosynthesis protein PslA